MKECWVLNSGSQDCVATSYSLIREDAESSGILVKKWTDMVSAVTDLGVMVQDIYTAASLSMSSPGPVSPEKVFGA